MSYAKIYADAFKSMRRLSPQTIGQAMKALVAYMDGEPQPEMSQGACVLFETMIDKIERDEQSYKSTCEKRKKAAESRWSSIASYNKQNDANASNDDANGCKSMQTDANAGNLTKPNLTKTNLTEEKESTEKKRKRFSPPTLDEVREYCAERNKGVDADRWYDYYQARGWKVGKDTMKDWRAAVRTWEHNGYGSSSPPAQRQQQGFVNPYLEMLKKECEGHDS